MKPSVRSRLENVVPHPRYGRWIRTTDTKLSEATIQEYASVAGGGAVFLETAIRANITRQRPSAVHRHWYFDMLKTCRTCARDFLFYAEEQRFWYEDLKFPPWCEAADCCDCRKASQQIRKQHQRFTRFSNALADDRLDQDSLIQFVEDAISFWQQGILKKRQKLNRIKNLAKQRLPDHPITRSVEAFVRSLDDDRAPCST